MLYFTGMVNENENTASYVRREFGHGDASYYSELYHLASTLQSFLLLNTLNRSKPLESRRIIDWNNAREGFIANLANLKVDYKEEDLLYAEQTSKLATLANQDWNEKVVKEMDAIIFQIILKLQGKYKGDESNATK